MAEVAVVWGGVDSAQPCARPSRPLRQAAGLAPRAAARPWVGGEDRAGPDPTGRRPIGRHRGCCGSLSVCEPNAPAQ